MKARIRKIILMAVALLFVGVGVSFADDGKKGYSRRAPGHSYGNYKKGQDGHYPGWNKKHPRPRYGFRDRHRYRHRVDHKFRYHHHPKYWHALHEKTVFRFKTGKPDYKIVVVVKDRR